MLIISPSSLDILCFQRCIKICISELYTIFSLFSLILIKVGKIFKLIYLNQNIISLPFSKIIAVRGKKVPKY